MGFSTETAVENPSVNGEPCTGAADGKMSCMILDPTQLGDANVSIIIINLYKGKLSTVIGSASRYEFPDLLAVFTAKYGAPSMAEEDWRNGAGAVLKNSVATWKFKTGTLELKAIGSSMKDTDFAFIDMSNQEPAKAPDVNF